MDAGLSPLGYDEIIAIPQINSWITDAINVIIMKPIALACFIGWIGTEVAVFAGMYAGPVGFAIAFGASIFVKYALLRMNWDSGESLKGSFVGALFSWAYGFLATLNQIINLGITALSSFLKISDLNFWKLLSDSYISR